MPYGHIAQYNSTPPVYPNGYGVDLQTDVNGNLKIAGGGSDGQSSASVTPVAAVYNSSAPTYTTGQTSELQSDANGNLKVTLATLIAGENLTTNRLNVEPVYSFQNISSTATTVVKSGAGTLHTITINKPVASSVITIYDNTAASGTLIATITLPATLLQEGPYSAIYDVSFSTGLTIVTATGASDITASYR